MNILVACEESQAVTKEFRVRGHNAFSCDIVPQSGGHKEWHIMQDVLPLLNGDCKFKTEDGVEHCIDGKWDMILAFPPCTHLAVSGARHFEKKREDGRQREGIEFFMNFYKANCDKIAIENPVGIISGEYIKQHFPDLQEEYNFPIKPTQIVQPYQFGDKFTKTTCLWLKGLPELTPTNIVEKGEFKEWVGKNGKVKRQGLWYYEALQNAKTPDERAKIRSKTFTGIAKAMASQWGSL